MKALMILFYAVIWVILMANTVLFPNDLTMQYYWYYTVIDNVGNDMYQKWRTIDIDTVFNDCDCIIQCIDIGSYWEIMCMTEEKPLLILIFFLIHSISTIVTAILIWYSDAKYCRVEEIVDYSSDMKPYSWYWWWWSMTLKCIVLLQHYWWWWWW